VATLGHENGRATALTLSNEAALVSLNRRMVPCRLLEAAASDLADAKKDLSP